MKPLLWNWHYMQHMSNISRFPLASSVFLEKTTNTAGGGHHLHYQPLTCLAPPLNKITNRSDPPRKLGMQLSWNWVVCPVLGNGGLLPADQTLLKSATGHQQKVSNLVQQHSTCTNPGISRKRFQGLSLKVWLLTEWGLKIVLVTLRICFASLEMVIFAASKVDC